MSGTGWRFQALGLGLIALAGCGGPDERLVELDARIKALDGQMKLGEVREVPLPTIKQGEWIVDVLTDPSTYYTPLMFLAPRETGGCSNGVCSDMINWNRVGPTSSYNPAGGGFLLYPNKGNTNMMQSVYSK